jgi:hypothetical protein
MAAFTATLLALVLMQGCTPKAPDIPEPPRSYAGQYVGYSWQGEAQGVALANATQYIETILELDDKGIITDAKMRFFVKVDGYWTTRQSGNATVAINYAVTPEAATPGDSYARGKSMFTVSTADMMSFYASGVNTDGTVAAVLVCPVTRYQYEVRLPANFDFSTKVSDLTIGSGLLVPTVRTSAGGLLRPSDWASLANKTIFDISVWSHVVNDVGIFAGVNNASSVQRFLEAMGVTFVDGKPQTKPATYGYFGLGGWTGNYGAVEQWLIGKDATQVTSLVDWSVPRYAGAINDKNQFGIDVASGATRTVQNSIDGISGATVRISRESTSYQRALVRAGIIAAKDVIIGRF